MAETTYHDDGKVATITAGYAVTSYAYNRRGLLVSERLQYDGLDWATHYAYTPGGDLDSILYRDGHLITYAPNALGQPTQAGAYVGGVSYYPNGAVQQFTYGNGIVHSMIQNARQLPERSRDALGGTAILDESYDYDFNGNVVAISDGLPGAPGDRVFAYDALDRLIGVTAGPAPGGNATFAFDPLDNLRVADQGGRQFRYHYDPATNRLAALKTPGGATLYTFGFDARGNQTTKTPAGQPAETFTFDRANRLTATSGGAASYFYDGLGRRVKGGGSGAAQWFYYSLAGQQLYSRDVAAGGSQRSYIYFAGSLVARRTQANSGGAVTVTYLHTDALGTPVRESDISGVATPREWLTVWGEPVDGSYQNGPGFTGHQNDSVTRLSYMQQRYYDPLTGRFLSNDPVSSSSEGANFNRYWYADNDPMKNIDRDGRHACMARVLCASMVVVHMATTARLAKPGSTQAQRDMVPIVSDGHSTPLAATLQAAADTKATKEIESREPNVGIIRTNARGTPETYGYTRPIWTEKNARSLDMRAYSNALIAVYGSRVHGLWHAHWDNNWRFSPPDIMNRGHWRYYLRNMGGETRHLDDEVQRRELRRAGFRNIDDYRIRNAGMDGICIDSCIER
ncbi:RHS repeat domain-containing protein [Arenimonas composti]|uniref:Teneurin-like YD-shell domain-containing protein n=1 Tax=Arenimonas composti TR7-09 = DSM 18010 TaxID=1121013 RepID=A0A091C1X6_9GAMM|nr:RHS repeat-associated core domain-containing protein [Arenimonas composti]KFN50645.1 hypothetical protein P873_05655 [Arenimonas composti TR7-09 = DSM 18010]